ncbi:ATP-dependent DNA helicase RecG [Gemella sp. zg-1178]|uniref:ATP-dependent DNA helicase RecG n=1 Tax=Gemella sp. zg-1178 TaxID=2840372 RepID=UPI001C059628|nr:ATP-dependent DNA helicase RecG [Gemella sp. zg-1178]MBU0278850.1 ATP-dependent DNA helicase RecG [Gemella sp. zg-1178]
MNNILEYNLNNISDIGPKTLEVLNSLGISSVKDLLFNIPYRINHLSDLSADMKDGEKVNVYGTISSKPLSQFYSKRKSRTQFLISTEIGIIKIVFFNQEYLKKYLSEGQKILIIGRYSKSSNTITASKINFNNEELLAKSKNSNIEVLYHLKQGISQKKYSKLVATCFELIDKNNYILDLVPKNFKGIWDLSKILYTLHFPKDVLSFYKAKKMFAFHELLEYQLKLQLQNINNSIVDEDYKINIDLENINSFIKTLNFDLTNSQKSVIDEIIIDLSRPHPMERLLQGDVGCGKTVVAATLVYGVIKSGYQAAIMAPTEILASQHFETFFDFFKNLDVSIALLTSSTPKKEKEKILKLLSEGQINILVGTHAIIQKNVIFKNLKFAITDEQHRFGVNQRKFFAEKGEKVNTLMMTATPIPRSLAISLISNIKVSTISELPQGRKKVKTYKASTREINSVFDNILIELEKGRQGYVVCPLIEESEKIDLKNVDEMYEKIKNYFPDRVGIAILHGKMKNAEKDSIVEKFLNKQIDILISTTVIEVGVNVPNASFMLIMDANRFGLATLHQLRGRVGRSSHQSYCILISDVKSERIDIMCLENDGFKISEFDLKNRGPGDFFGIRQSGLPSFKVADIINDTELMYLAKQLASKLIEFSENTDRIKSYINLSKTRY